MTASIAAPVRVPQGRRPIATVLLATDLSAASEHATGRAIEVAVALRARLLVLNVLEHGRLDGFGSHARVDQARAEREGVLQGVVRRARDAGARCEFMLWAGEPSGSIVAVADAEEADLIVAGTHGRARAGRLLLGSVSDHLVRSAHCPVMVVRSD